jgi:hypothetical protein
MSDTKPFPNVFAAFSAGMAGASAPILCWDKPAKRVTTAEWKEEYGFDGGPVGGFMPNMSEEDEAKWKAKLTGTKLGFPQVEIRKTLHGAQLLVIVNLGSGYNYKHYRALSERYHGKTPADFTYRITQAEIDRYAERDSTKGIQIHMAMNGPAQMSFQDIADLNQAVFEAKTYLESL